jgi:NADPH-dependent glutamate synthase beta subunit-like oxidoreductase
MVIIYGSNYAAIDAARTAVRLGSENVYLAFKAISSKRSNIIESIKEAEAEGVKVISDVEVKRIATLDGSLIGIEFVNHLGISMHLPCESLILGLGTQVELEKLDPINSSNGFIKIISKTGATDIEGVFAGGDAVRNANIITAISAGKTAAVSMDQYILGAAATLKYTESVVCVNTEDVLQRVGYFKEEGTAIGIYDREAKVRRNNFETYTRPLTEEEAVKEASRCLNCGCGEGCQLCKTICCDFAPYIVEADTLKIEPNDCVACGMCFNRCPNKNIEMVNTGKNV